MRLMLVRTGTSTFYCTVQYDWPAVGCSVVLEKGGAGLVFEAFRGLLRSLWGSARDETWWWVRGRYELARARGAEWLGTPG
eukprot:COSAG02_NODE_14707_length_1244_cov_18.143231_2_plen_81_part_00